jgi:glycerol-3-phosphate dehydrogenase (NAD(P)+)
MQLAVLGAGSWGTALALVLARGGHSVRLWAHRREHAEALNRERCNRRYLPQAALTGDLQATASLEDAVAGAELVLAAVPSHAFAALLQRLAALPEPPAALAWATKGLDAESGGLLHHRVEQVLPGSRQAVLSGPSFAAEVARGLPTAVTVASADATFARQVADAFHGERFRVYTSDDVVGVELGGAVKNVLAIATGIADGLGFGANARAGLITRGLAEVRRLGRIMGAADHTLMGLSGVGDLILTCTDDQSRNRRMGLALGRGLSLVEAEREIGQTVEGLRTAGELARLSAARGVDMPICRQVHRLVAGDIDAASAARELMTREPKSEFD